MDVTALGHSCLLLDFEHPTSGEHTRILVDPWLSDHATGDAMGRFPRLRFAMQAIEPLHAVFISHAHSDHLDPYTLIRLWRELTTPPVLLLPVTLAFLLPIFREHLPGLEVRLLHPQVPQTFRGLGLLGLYDVGMEPTNEEDVLVLVVTNGSERVLVEADARLSLELVNFREHLSRLLRGRGITSAVYLTTENELTGTLESRNCRSIEDRELLADAAMQELIEAVEVLYEPVDDAADLWQASHLLRLVHGQGLTVPHELDPTWQRVLFPVRIADRVQIERTIAAQNGCQHQIDALTVGCVHTITAGRIVRCEPLPGLELLDREDQRNFDAYLPFFPEFPCAPLRADVRDIEAQRARLLAVLNGRFLPYLHGTRQPPVLHLLAELGGSYRIRVHYGRTAWDYVLAFDAWGFVEVPAAHEPHEAYWANDLEDFLDGRCDEYTPFCRTQFLVPAMRLWACLATPLLNADLVAKRVALHFELASAGADPGSYVLALYDQSPG